MWDARGAYRPDSWRLQLSFQTPSLSDCLKLQPLFNSKMNITWRFHLLISVGIICCTGDDLSFKTHSFLYTFILIRPSYKLLLPPSMPNRWIVNEYMGIVCRYLFCIFWWVNQIIIKINGCYLKTFPYYRLRFLVKDQCQQRNNCTKKYIM